MRFVQSALAAAALAAAFCFAPVAAAQSASVVVIDYERVIATSEVGRNITQQFQAIGQQIQNELTPEQTALEQEEQRIRTSTQGMTAEQVQANSSLTQQINQFGQRVETFRARQVSLARDLEYTRQVTLNEFNQQITPHVRAVMEARGAGVVIDTSTAQLYAPGVDVTDDVVARLNGAMRTMTVTRRTAPAQQPNGQQ